MKRKKAKLTRRFILAEGIFENDGMMLDLPKVVSASLPFDRVLYCHSAGGTSSYGFFWGSWREGFKVGQS